MNYTSPRRPDLQTKLTLRLDGALIERAKSWARDRGISLSEAVASFFAQLPDADQAKPRLKAWTRSLAGAAATAEPPPSDEQIRAEYLAHLERKHA